MITTVRAEIIWVLQALVLCVISTPKRDCGVIVWNVDAIVRNAIASAFAIASSIQIRSLIDVRALHVHSQWKQGSPCWIVCDSVVNDHACNVVWKLRSNGGSFAFCGWKLKIGCRHSRIPERVQMRVVEQMGSSTSRKVWRTDRVHFTKI